MTPARRLEDVSNLVRPLRCAANVLPHLLILTEGNGHHSVTSDIFGQAVNHRLFFLFLREGAEQTIPDNEGGAMVTVKVTDV